MQENRGTAHVASEKAFYLNNYIAGTIHPNL